mgnify:CR=1 FL=1
MRLQFFAPGIVKHTDLFKQPRHGHIASALFAVFGLERDADLVLTQNRHMHAFGPAFGGNLAAKGRHHVGIEATAPKLCGSAIRCAARTKARSVIP